MPPKKQQAVSIPCFKICMIGQMFTGKTNLVTQYVSNQFEKIYLATEDYRVYRRIADISSNPDDQEEVAEYVMIEILDNFGSDHPKIQTDSNMKAHWQKVLENRRFKPEGQSNVLFAEKVTMGFMFVFDLGIDQTFKDICNMIGIISDSESKNKQFAVHTKKMLVGTKMDKGKEGVSQVEIDKICEEHKMQFIKTSALENYNVQKAFEDLAKQIQTDPVLWKFDDQEAGTKLLAQMYMQQASKLNKGDDEEEDADFGSTMIKLVTCGAAGSRKPDANKKTLQAESDSDEDLTIEDDQDNKNQQGKGCSVL